MSRRETTEPRCQWFLSGFFLLILVLKGPISLQVGGTALPLFPPRHSLELMRSARKRDVGHLLPGAGGTSGALGFGASLMNIIWWETFLKPTKSLVLLSRNQCCQMVLTTLRFHIHISEVPEILPFEQQKKGSISTKAKQFSCWPLFWNGSNTAQKML